MQSAKLFNPAQVCAVLNITPGNIKRLTLGGYLEVKGQVQYKNGIMQLFNSRQVEELAPYIPRIKQAWERSDNYRYGAHRLASERNREQKFFHRMVKHKEQFLNEINDYPDANKKLLEACYYLYHLNHYAKAENAYLYDIKELVLKAFVQNYYSEDELIKIFSIEGDNKTVLCPSCKAKAESRHISYVDYLNKTGGCPSCIREYKYYSLFEFIINYRDYLFCFHTPYKTSKKWFNQGTTPPKKDRPQREGAYAFGRAIHDSEARAVELIEVVDKLQDFLSSFGIEPIIDTGF